MLKQISVVTCNLKHLARRIKTKAGPDHFAILPRMLDPSGRVGREICVLAKDGFRFHVLPQLNQEASAADKHMERVVRLHLVDLVGSEKALAERRHSEVDKGRLKRLIA